MAASHNPFKKCTKETKCGTGSKRENVGGGFLDHVKVKTSEDDLHVWRL